MTRIAFLQSKETIDRVFTAEQIERLRALGEVVLNEHSGPITPEQTKQQIKDADIAITSWGCLAINEDILASAPNLKAVLHAAGTIKGIVTPELWDKGVRVSNATEPLGKGVAETALGLTIASLKDMWRLTQNTRAGGWRGVSRVRELYEVTVGVVGAGKAGGHYIKLLQNFDVKVVLYDPIITHEAAAELGAKKVEFEQLLALSDVISIHAPSLPETNKMFNKETLALMKDDCILINTARGSIIDEPALIEELRKGRLFAALDVTNPEPPAEDHPIRELPNAILLPHIAGSVNNGLHRLGAFIIDDIERFLNNEKMRGEVTSDQMSILA
jgi:phosphoglycerate dehydrogenase-like enzyme